MRAILAKNRQAVLLSVVLLFFLVFFFILLPKALSDHYVFSLENSTSSLSAIAPEKIIFTPSYVSTPKPVKGIYLTSWTASNVKLRNDLVKLIDDTEINAIVIDIKDYSGKIVFPVENAALKQYGSEDIRNPDLREFIESLHKKSIYVIARIAVFQDAYFVKFRPDLAVKNLAGEAVWKDYKGISWIDPGSREYWDYIVLLSKEARKIGFDEINFDYIRFPSDGNMQDISYPWSSTTPKTLVMKSFFAYLRDSLIPLGDASGEERLKISADLFGMTTSAKDDMGIGQLLENTFPYFDYVSPMVYPSHYSSNFQGFQNPAKYPYEVVHFSMMSAVDRASKMNMVTTTTEIINDTTTKVSHIEDLNYKEKLRPWLQDFDLGADYGSAEVRAEIKATYDAGLDSWMLWSASNKYTSDALE